MVVHGQILLNQFQHFPNKAVARSAFVGVLKERMAQRRHHMLYSAPRTAARVRGLRANPMRDRASARAKPMTATATAMVRAVWESYFPASQPGALPCRNTVFTITLGQRPNAWSLVCRVLLTMASDAFLKMCTKGVHGYLR